MVGNVPALLPVVQVNLGHSPHPLQIEMLLGLPSKSAQKLSLPHLLSGPSTGPPPSLCFYSGFLVLPSTQLVSWHLRHNIWPWWLLLEKNGSKVLTWPRCLHFIHQFKRASLVAQQ